MVVLNSSEVIREALVKKWSDFAGRPISYTGDIVSGGGRSISLGDYSEEWKIHRRLVHSALHRCCQQSLHNVIERQAVHLRKVLMDYQGSAVDLSEDFTVAASNVITTLAFGKEYDKSSSELQQLHNCLNEIVGLWGSSWISALDSFPLLRLQDKKAEDAITGSILQGLDKHHNTEHGVLLTDTHVHMATVDLLIGGTETTAAWLNWTVAFLLHRPEVQTTVYEELCTVLGGRDPKCSDLGQLPHWRYHTEPSETAERFLDGGEGSTRALMPFGGGARLCLGESVAKMELFLFTAYLLRDFQFIPPEDEASLPDLKGVASVVLKVNSYKVIAHPRLVADS
ncbi:hypothetical protein PAMP_003267 [Pampus punctatissimus]